MLFFSCKFRFTRKKVYLGYGPELNFLSLPLFGVSGRRQDKVKVLPAILSEQQGHCLQKSALFVERKMQEG